MSELRCNGGKGSARLRVVEFLISSLMSLFAVGAWGVRRRRRGLFRRNRANRAPIGPRTNSGPIRIGRRRRSGCGGSGCGCIVILVLIPAIVLFGGLVLFRTEIIEIIYNLTGFDLQRFLR